MMDGRGVGYNKGVAVKLLKEGRRRRFGFVRMMDREKKDGNKQSGEGAMVNKLELSVEASGLEAEVISSISMCNGVVVQRSIMTDSGKV